MNQIVRRVGTAALVAFTQLYVPAVGDTVPGPTDGASAAPRYQSPATPLVVLRGFEPPLTRYSAGHRGVDLAATLGAVVVAAGPGVVSFAGAVAGRGVVVIAHADGVSTEYEPLLASVTTGQSVRGGQVIGTLNGAHPGCTTACVHWGAMRGGEYVDPLTLLRRLGVVRLIPDS